MSRVCSRCGNAASDGNPITHVNGVGTCAKCSGSTAYVGKAILAVEGFRKVQASGSAEVVVKPARAPKQRFE